MKDTAKTPGERPSFWRRLFSMIVEIEKTLERTHDDIQDRRLNMIEAELAQLRGGQSIAPVKAVLK
jgi:hypothetical protein